MLEQSKVYPGDSADADQVLKLAEEYRRAAMLLHERDRHGARPWRFLAIHAIELYLNAVLIGKGYEQSSVRSMQHSLSRRAEMAAHAGLNLRKKTHKHLSTLEKQREYLVSRYEPDPKEALSEINRLNQTLEELAHKAKAAVIKPGQN